MASRYQVVKEDRDQASTLWVGNLDENVTEALLWELFLQAGPVMDVNMPLDKVTGQSSNFAFVEMRSEMDAEYAMKVMNMVRMFGKPIRINKASNDKESSDVGANLFIGNLDKEVDDQLLFTTFSAFGLVVNAKVMLDEANESRGFGFVNFASFDAADAAMGAMNNQYLCNKPISVSYAYKNGSKGEKHGTAAERTLAVRREHTTTTFAATFDPKQAAQNY